MQTIGILLSRSSYYQTIGFDLYEGLRSGLKQLGRDDIKIVTENIGFGTDKQQCYRSAEKLLLEENATIVIAYIGHRTAQLLRPLFLAANKILIVLDAGANIPQEWPSCPNIFYHSLHNALGAALAAKEATNDGYTNGGIVTGYYDAGYLHTYSLSKSFQDMGGTITFNHATGYQTHDFKMEPLKDHLKSFPDSALLTLFSGEYVEWYFEQMKNIFNGKNLPVYLSPFGLEETMLSNTVYASENIKGIAAWSKKIKSAENERFVETITELGRIPNLFSLLSWECASIVLKVLELSREHKNNISGIAQDLHSFSFVSPRGTIHFDAKTNTSISPLYKVAVIPNEEGKCELQLESEAPEVQEDYNKLTNQDLEHCTSAWHNSYVCI
ncbi:ABC transporter substrate-binding protein [Flavobacterium kingsejongi]|uniref:ABC transporter substrate-binding protein n=1 Tax=Flavobacterium kingsejongi TaxID=1678728 RepID=A0A2S1LTX1_9FLAO|nr:ABC transporter substrate-binding protein [Flavobacterium kingsejongi]AWG27076.1 ABC transporter substrate-binding protein [Flavobacterium kingsejongi]